MYINVINRCINIMNACFNDINVLKKLLLLIYTDYFLAHLIEVIKIYISRFINEEMRTHKYIGNYF